jgi:hypothetical protein
LIGEQHELDIDEDDLNYLSSRYAEYSGMDKPNDDDGS